jgi:Tir chaperone protein (CesT) family
MISSQFGAILKELEAFFDCSLEPDANNSCLITMGIGISIQIELDRYGLLLVGCRLGVIHMGRYRDNIMKEALKSNELTPPSTGIFGFSQKSNQLILFLKIDPLVFSIHQILALMPPFITKAKLWTDAIGKGEVPSVTAPSSTKEPSGLFGLIS